MKKVLSILFLVVLLAGCGNAEKVTSLEAQLTELSNENTELKKQLEDSNNQLEEIKFGPSTLLSEAKLSFEQGDIEKLKSVSDTITEKHPASTETIEVSALVQQLENKIAEEKKRVEQEEKQKAEEEKKRQEAAVANMRKRVDEVTSVTVYEDKTSPKYINSNAFMAMITQKENESPVLLARFMYTGDNWLFIEKYTIKADDQTFEISPSYNEINRDNQVGGVWEYYTTIVGKDMHEIITAVINSKKTIIRSEGKERHQDRTVTDEEKKALQNVLDAFKAMGGNDIQFTL
ncbi:hypothetical protein ACE3MQ_24855 [Paenibacillus lentus]|uniref:hypothetical protein n=1 Tax=Paenibacillus lentus TaxID=1338368 RepID=UPI00365A1BAA